MTLRSELANWEAKRLEAESKLKLNLDDPKYQKTWGSASRIAGENINRVKNVLLARPWQDEIQAEELRHDKAITSIMARYKTK